MDNKKLKETIAFGARAKDLSKVEHFAGLALPALIMANDFDLDEDELARKAYRIGVAMVEVTHD